MTTVNFPTPTTVGETYTFGNRTWTWTGNFWMATSTTVGYTGSTGYVGSRGASGSATNPWQVKTEDYTAVDGDRIIANTTFGSFNITLPATPSAGHYIQITDGLDFSVYPVTIIRNGNSIEGYNDNLALDLKGATFELIYNGATWQVTATTGPVGPIGYTGSTGPGVITLQQPGNLTTFIGTARWYAPYNCNIIRIVPRVRLAAGVDILASVVKNGTPAVSLTIPAGQTTGPTNTATTAMSAGDYLTVNVLQAGQGTGSGADLYVQVQYIAV